MATPHAAGVMVADPGGRLLFMRRKDDGNWAWPAGSIEGSETPEQAARRETQEETGLITGDLTQIDVGDGFVTFYSEVAAQFDPTMNEEHSEYRWALPEQAPMPLHPGVVKTLAKLAPREGAGGALDKREYDINGWFEVPDNPLSGVGVFQYSEASVRKGGDRNKMVGVYRPAEELDNPECINSFKLMPWTDDHPSDLLGDTDKGFADVDEKGVRGVIGEKVYFKDRGLFGNIKAFSKALMQKIAAGKRELSVGYHCDFVPQEGEFEGVPYQYVQRNIRGNHLATVKQGKMGARATVQDSVELAIEPFLTFALDMREIVAVAKDAISESQVAQLRKLNKEHRASPSETTKEAIRTQRALMGVKDSARDDEVTDCLDAETEKFIQDSFNSLVGELETKGYSKEYATKVAGKVAAEKGMTGHSTTDGDIPMAKDANVTDPVKEKDKPNDKASPGAGDSMSSEEEAGMDAKEAATDASEEDKDKDDTSKEANDRRRARDRKAGARDARGAARDKMARDAKAAKDKEDDEDKDGKGMDASEVTALVRREISGKAMDETAIAALVERAVTARVATIGPTIRKEEVAKASLYGKLSPIVGAFDHAEMTHVDMAAYGLDKLGAPKAADPVMALDYLLVGRNASAAALPRRPQFMGGAQDAGEGSFVDKYIAA